MATDSAERAISTVLLPAVGLLGTVTAMDGEGYDPEWVEVSPSNIQHSNSMDFDENYIS